MTAEEEEKVESLLAGGEPDTEAIRTKYDEIYRHEEVWRRRTFVGYASLVLHLLRPRLEGARVLDAGCGAGKLALMMSRHAQWVHGVDFSDEAIRIARLLAHASRTDNITFYDRDMQDLPEAPPYDIVTLIGTLEHVHQPADTLRSLSRVMEENGVLVVECPGFLNMRGDIYMTLLTLLGLPMSLADLRQVDYKDIIEWASRADLEVRTVCGYSYALGWLDKAVSDMANRTPKALKDRGLEDAGWDVERLQWWMENRLHVNHQLMKRLETDGILKRIPVQPPVDLHMNTSGATSFEDVPQRVQRAFEVYLEDYCDDDPWYCTSPPYCYLGGGTIYLLAKL